ncbi:SPOR domain-containing protein [bacterium]|nr:MAG: SPOR domain-containing protein [bacterium]
MDKTNYSQLELFGQPKELYQKKNDSSNSSFFYNVKKNEKVILVVIGFLCAGIISFVLGVEKGKRIVSASLGPNFDLATKEAAFAPKAAAGDTELVKVNRDRLLAKKENSTKTSLLNNKTLTLKAEKTKNEQGFTIQVASYKGRNSAQREAEALKKKGLLAIVLTKSGYNVLCVGNFSNKGNAQSLLSQLKKQYPDCRIRRL